MFKSKTRRSRRLPHLTQQAYMRAQVMVKNRTQKQVFTGIRFGRDNTRKQAKTAASLDIVIRQKKLKLENVNMNEPLSHYLDDDKIFKFLGIAFSLNLIPRHNGDLLSGASRQNKQEG